MSQKRELVLVKFPPMPVDLLRDIDPSNVSIAESGAKEAKQVSAAEVTWMRLSSSDLFLMMYLANYGMTSNPALTTLLSSSPKGASDIGFHAVCEALMTQHGITFDPNTVFGSTTSRAAAYNKLLRRSHKHGCFRSVVQGANNYVKAELQSGGFRTLWTLTEVGAGVLLHLAKNPDLKESDIKFAGGNSHVALRNHLHQQQVGDLLTMLLSGANFYSTQKNARVEVLDLRGDGRYYSVGVGNETFAPDASGRVRIGDFGVPFHVEWDTGTTKSDALPKKVKNFIRYIDTGEHGIPWLLLVHPESGEARTKHVNAIKKAFKDLFLTGQFDDEQRYGIAICTHSDLGRLGVYGEVWQVWKPKEGRLTEEKYPLLSLNRGKVDSLVETAEEPTKPEPVPAVKAETAPIPVVATPAAVEVAKTAPAKPQTTSPLNMGGDPTTGTLAPWFRAIAG